MAALAALVHQTSLSPLPPGPSRNLTAAPPRSPAIPSQQSSETDLNRQGSHPLPLENTTLGGASGNERITVPIPGAIIPNVGRDAYSWKRAVDQWYHGDPANGLVVPIKDWPVQWYTGSMRLKTGTLYSNRKLLAEEFARLNFNEVAFKEKYPDYGKITTLLVAIRKENGLKRRSPG
ncbi:hypothetical protein C8R46DRAFT_1027878 [Mycena filopes]|nr:hypothetical protein C8R46DRAFT_1027878 [Mycena filopes]